MNHFQFSNNLLKTIKSLNNDQNIGPWIYKGHTSIAYGTPNGPWDVDGFLFERNDKKYSYILRSVPNQNASSFIVLESVNMRGQLYNMDLNHHKTFKENLGKTYLLESYRMTVGKGKKKEIDVQNAFKLFDIHTNEISVLDDVKPDWLKTISDILNWAIIRENVKVILKDNNQKKNVAIPLKLELNKTALNLILYGPPGTGKTYTLQKKYFDQFTINESSVTREQYLEQIVADLNWWQVISIAVLDIGVAKVNDIFDHEFVKIKASLSSSKTIRPTIWGQLQSHTVLDCPNVNVSNRSEPLYFNKNEASEWTIDNELVKQYYPEAIELLASSKNYTPEKGSTIKNYEFITFHQSFSYEDFIEGIKPKMDDGDTDIAYEIKDGVFKKLCLKAEADPTNPYALFIDEINRGNVSAIFGELITLIEEDKRLDAENELRVKLPYSKKDFGVPSNLYIIGTMNTADRSVEALDTALRRRFCFEELLPNTSLLQDRKFNDFNLQEVLETINDRIEALLDRDHTIGHSYFLKVGSNDTKALQSVFENNIVPLLQEYFYHDYEKIALVLGEGFVTLHSEKETQIRFASFSKETLDKPESPRRFALIKNISQIESAVGQLLNRA